jgi:hypothetical protein
MAQLAWQKRQKVGWVTIDIGYPWLRTVASTQHTSSFRAAILATVSFGGFPCGIETRLIGHRPVQPAQL